MRHCLIESLLFHVAFHNLTQDAFLHSCSWCWSNPAGMWSLSAKVCQWYFLLSSSFSTEHRRVPHSHGLAAWSCSKLWLGSLLWLLAMLNLTSPQGQTEPCTHSFCCQHCPQTQTPLRWHMDGHRGWGIAELSDRLGEALLCAAFLLPQLTGTVSCGHHLHRA